MVGCFVGEFCEKFEKKYVGLSEKLAYGKIFSRISAYPGDNCLLYWTD